ncbi:hypothetical protein Tco_0027967, partial [Tanacetum coccineum]
DAYFDDESAEAFISLLHLGDDDQESVAGSLLILLLGLREINAANTVRVNNVLLILC